MGSAAALPSGRHRRRRRLLIPRSGRAAAFAYVGSPHGRLVAPALPKPRRRQVAASVRTSYFVLRTSYLVPRTCLCFPLPSRGPHLSMLRSSTADDVLMIGNACCG